MIDLFFEIGADLFQSLMFIGFLYFYFEKKYTKGKNIFLLSSAVLILFTVLNIFLFVLPPFNYIDSLLYILIMIAYASISLKGRFTTKIIITLCSFLINAVLSCLFGFLMSVMTGTTLYDLAIGPSFGRYICIVLVNFTTALVYLIIIKFKSASVHIKSITDIVSFILIPTLSLLTVYSSVYVLILSEYRESIVPFLITIVVCMIVITAIVWFLISRISKDNEIRTKILLMEQQEVIYKKNILQTNEQIKKISHIKHDINNNILCISDLISRKEYEKAKLICDEIAKTSENTYTPMATKNPLLNAIFNVEMDKASNLGIKLVVAIYDNMNKFEKFTDIVSIIGNLCDNAIEYISKNDLPDKRVIFEIKNVFDMCILTCTNAVKESVLIDNPELNTSKDDKENHGYGIEIIKTNAQKHLGELSFMEKDGYITFMVTLKY